MVLTRVTRVACVLGLLPVLGCKELSEGKPDPAKPIPELLQSFTAKQLVEAGVVTPVAPGDLEKFFLEGHLCMPGARAEWRPGGTWSESEVDGQGKVVRSVEGTWVAEPSGCFRLALGPDMKIGCVADIGTAFRAKDGKRYLSAPPRLWMPCP